MKEYEYIQYRDCFNSLNEWETLTENLDEKTIRSIKRLMLKYEVYKDFDFNPDHLNQYNGEYYISSYISRFMVD